VFRVELLSFYAGQKYLALQERVLLLLANVSKTPSRQVLTNAQPKTSELRGYLPTLDGWRAIAILIVLFFHSRDALIRVFGAPMARLGPHMLLWGPFGVDLFFAISGLLITSRLIAEESSSGSISLKGFYIRRAFRILPPSLTYLAVIGVLGGLGIIAFRLDSWIAALFFYVNFTTEPLWYVGHFWSLAVEEHFYAFWPALLVFVKTKYRLRIALVLCLLVFFWRVVNYKYAAIGLAMGSTYFDHQGRTDFQIDGILWGAALALAYDRFSNKPWFRRLLTLPVGAVLFSIVLGSLIVSGNWKLLQALLLFRKIAIPVVLLITVLNCRGIVASVFEQTLLRKIGRLSYSLYLWQQLFLVWHIESLTHVPWVNIFPLNLLCTFTCAAISYRFLERPFIRMGHRAAKWVESSRLPLADDEIVA